MCISRADQGRTHDPGGVGDYGCRDRAQDGQSGTGAPGGLPRRGQRHSQRGPDRRGAGQSLHQRFAQPLGAGPAGSPSRSRTPYASTSATSRPQHGETDHYSVQDHLQVLEEHVGGAPFDFVVANGNLTDHLPPRWHSEPVRVDPDAPLGVRADATDRGGRRRRGESLPARPQQVSRHGADSLP